MVVCWFLVYRNSHRSTFNTTKTIKSIILREQIGLYGLAANCAFIASTALYSFFFFSSLMFFFFSSDVNLGFRAAGAAGVIILTCSSIVFMMLTSSGIWTYLTFFPCNSHAQCEVSPVAVRGFRQGGASCLSAAAAPLEMRVDHFRPHT